ncbi:MAG TPA: methylated-DNA--[protein]-cysteine S-methyltransferase [Afifellaceae bacterium]|nr:methylated-DNA--[protein]-cysteine S-methyltransferase [Afifellaceae bacterium]
MSDSAQIETLQTGEKPRLAASGPRFSRDLRYSYVESPVGALLVAGDGDRIHLISFPQGSRALPPQEGWRRDDTLFSAAFEQLDAYFAGQLRQFDLPLHFSGTPFQNAVWTALCDIPFGQTLSYGGLAEWIGRPTASRAVGAANGANPLPIVVPCHRVIGSDRSLTGFGGGIETKRFLLELENAEGFQRRLI